MKQITQFFLEGESPTLSKVCYSEFNIKVAQVAIDCNITRKNLKLSE